MSPLLEVRRLSKRFATRFRICDRLRFADFLGFTISTQSTITFNSSALTGFASFGSTAISKSEEQDAIDNFPDIKPEACGTAIAALRTALSGIATGGFREARALDELIVKGIAAYMAAKAALEACPALLGGFDA